MNNNFYFVIGTRAQLIKTAPVMKEFENKGVPYVSIYTGQHKETIDDIWKGFNIHPADINLFDHFSKETDTLFRFFYWSFLMVFLLFFPKKILKKGKGIVITHGDTFSSVWGAILGKMGSCKVAHLESGLRSFNLLHPFPEEINRLIVFLLTDYYFCPNDWAVKNLKKFRGQKIITNGNSLIDAVRLAQDGKSKTLSFFKKPYCVVSIHRFENLYPNKILKKNCEIIERIAKSCPCVFILHPVTKKRLQSVGLLDHFSKNSRIFLQNRLGFFDFIHCISESEFVVTDGGSNQEESSYLGIPCLLLRHKTERIEGLTQNVVLSDYNEVLINTFINSYKSYKQKNFKIEEMKPSEIIANYLFSLSS